jgi:ATP-dependent Lon protease
MSHSEETPQATDPIDEVREYPLLALRDMVLFPGQVLPVPVGRPRSRAAIESAVSRDSLLAAVPQDDPAVEDPQAGQLARWGTLLRVLKVLRIPDGSLSVVVQGEGRLQILDFDDEAAPTRVRAHRVAESEASAEDIRIEALSANIRRNFESLVHHAPDLSPEHLVLVHNAESPGGLADIVASLINLDAEAKLAILATPSAEERLEEVHRALVHLLEVHELSSQIESQVQSEISTQQREHFLRSQIGVIRRELGDTEDEEDEIDRFRERAKELPEAAREAAEREIRRLARLNPASPEYGVTRNYLDWIFDVPWVESSEDDRDLERAREVLDGDHHGLEAVKKRIVEYLAVRKLKDDMKGPILCLVGPPGVGKTSLGRSVAQALGRQFQRISLGGVHDEAEIRGHRRTYIGALPGRIVQAMRKAGTTNPVLVLDEIDKLGRDWQGDPSSALLEVLDPEQNHSFSDHFLEVPYDLSGVLFIATANQLDGIPGPLRDRMEIIEIPGYTQEEKTVIAEGHLVPKQLREHGLARSQLKILKTATRRVIAEYTREAGVRTLERKIAAIARHAALQIAGGQAEKVRVGPKDLEEILGVPRFARERAEPKLAPGIATGLAWTPTGGEILYVEVARMPGKGKLEITGQLGEVMSESARAALTWMRSASGRLGLAPNFHAEHDVHVHVPAGAVPKDGPSAGVAMVCALVSAFLDRPLAPRLAMTGEITLRGRVLPVGGVKEKLLGAKRAGIRQVLIPAENRRDLEEIGEEVLDGLEIHEVSDIDAALEIALGLSLPQPVRPGKNLSGRAGKPQAARPPRPS